MALLDVFGWFFLSLIVVSLFVISFYAFVHLAHPLDKDYKGGWVGRALIIAGMAAPFVLVTLFEFDFLSHFRQKGMDFGFNFKMDLVWIPAMVVSALLCLAQFFFIQYYRNTKPWSTTKKILWSAFVCFWPLLIYAIVASNYFIAKSFSNFKVNSVIVDASALLTSETTDAILDKSDKTLLTINFSVQNRTMLISPFLLICSMMFSIFGGAGMAYFPIGLIRAFLNRPKEATAEELVFQKNVLRDESKKLLEKSKEVFDLRREMVLSNDMDKAELKIKKQVIANTSSNLIREVIDFEETFHAYKASQEFADRNPLYYAGCLVLGAVGALVSLSFAVDQLLLTMRIGGIYDKLFHVVRRVSSVYCMLFFFALCAYVYVATTKGSYKLSRIIFFIFQAFPVKANRTWTDAFLLNNIVVLMSMIGFFMRLLRSCPAFVSYLSLELMVKNIMRNPLMLFFHEYKIFKFAFLFSFMLAVFTSLLFASNKDLLKQQGADLKREYDKKKTDFLLMNKEVS